MSLPNQIALAMSDRGRLFSSAIIALAIVMGCKTLYLAFFVTPLWDIPDEIGHLAYVMQIANGGGMPVLGDAMIPAEIMSHMRQADSPAAGNWIAQHPPIYYFIAAVPYWLAQQFTSDVEILYRAPRIIASLSAVILLLVLYRTARLTGLSERASLCLAGCIGWIPMFSHLASGVNHDVPLFLVSALSAHFMARFVLLHNARDAYIAAIWLSIAGAMKMTAWVLLPPFVLLIAWELRGTWRPWLMHLSGITALAFIFPATWMLRNFWVYGNPMQTASNIQGLLSEPLQKSLFDYLNSHPVIDSFLLHYYGLIGWMGTGQGQVQLHVISGFPRAVFTLLMVVIGLILLLHSLKLLVHHQKTSLPSIPRFSEKFIGIHSRHVFFLPCLRTLSAALSVGIVFLLTYFSMKGDVGMNLRLYAIAVVVALGSASMVMAMYESNDSNRLFHFGLLTFFFFALVVIEKIYEIHITEGRFGAIHGRYFYPVLPWLLFSVSLALAPYSWGQRLLSLIFSILVIAETDAYINQVLPFIGGGQ